MLNSLSPDLSDLHTPVHIQNEIANANFDAPQKFVWPSIIPMTVTTTHTMDT